VLGVRYFWLVLALDLLKGFLPTLGFPWLMRRWPGGAPLDLPVLIALAAILGHTFPVYLKFRGGKGVATSLGCVLALDPVSCAVATLVFGVVLWSARYVSLASLVGGLAFAGAHFFRETTPWSREHIAMSLFTIAVVALLVVRHHSNLVRIWLGTESRVNIRRSGPRGERGSHPGGRVAVVVAVGLVVFSIAGVGGICVVHNARQPVEAQAGPWSLRETDRVNTGQQRVDRVAFTAGGDRLAGLGPRYNRLLVYQVDSRKTLIPIAETWLEGRPVSIAALGERFVVLERPAGDQKHLEPGWWETFDGDGKPVGTRHLAGFYPDDLAVSADGRLMFVLSSGRAEGDDAKPLPALEVMALDPQEDRPHLLGRLTMDPSDDPERLTLSATARFAAVFLAKSKRTAAVDLTTPESPRLIGRTMPVTADAPYLSFSPGSDWILMPAASASETLAIELPGTARSAGAESENLPAHRPDYLISTHQNESVLEIAQTVPRHALGRFPLRGPLNLGRTRPTGLAYSPVRGLLAVATRSGAIHLVELRSRLVAPEPQSNMLATSREDALRR
jgi:glycerol-3-phosphate acyltransferase PlsY